MPLASVEALQLTRICVEDCATAVTPPGTLGGVVSVAGAAGVVAVTSPESADSLAGVAASNARIV